MTNSPPARTLGQPTANKPSAAFACPVFARTGIRQRLPALVWKILLLHGAQARLVQNMAITGDAPGTLSRLGTERIQGQRAALLKITQEIPVRLQPAMVVSAGNQ